MGMNWTKEQEQVIRLQNRNILVSAAAGSGKTAVLVERILNMMTRKENPVDIDRLLIVTFTRAAAGEMKERLTAAVEKRLETEPENEHLQRQQTLIHNAQINTIDGFCSYVIRNYFHTIDLDPGFRTANEGELKLLKHDVIKELLEENYEAKNPAFENFVETFASGKSDEGIIDLILRLYEFSMSNPWPKEWLEECKKPYLAESFDELQESLWMEKLWEDALRSVEQAKELCEKNALLIQEEDGPYMYGDAVAADRQIVERLEKACTDRAFDQCEQVLSCLKFTALSRKKDESVYDRKREQVKRERDQLKDVLKGLKERYFYGDSGRILQEMQLCRDPVEELIRLTIDFIDAFAAKKRQKNLVDFSDMEHFALDILVKKQDGELIYTPAADEFSQRFEEILIDEYQDSNLVQETLLQSVSKLRQGRYNIFMVGDVKQSIYRFRLARPELFMEKYENYTHEESECQRIDLHKNFRSRAEVLAGVNYIFEQIMGKELGDVEYDEAAALYPGAVFPEPEEQRGVFESTEILIAGTDGTETEDTSEEQAETSAQEMEARMIGKRIREIVGKQQVVDKATGAYRPARCQDCVILLRTVSGWAETFVRVLSDMGIPAYASSRTGYFSALEVVTVLNYLHICDNPMQEIPFTGVLLSPMAGCTPEELAVMKAAFPDKKIYECAWKYHEEGENTGLREKLDKFFSVYQQIRERVPYTPIHELIQKILSFTGYHTYAAAMPGGDQRKANLEMLVEKAMEYESTSYRGLFNFIRYMEQLQKYQVDFGEVSTMGENEDTVRIMSIHKSKGLEFPIVFVAGMGKRFNMMDANAGLVIHADLGIGMNAIDQNLRVKIPTLMRQVMQKQIRLESLGEELRVLYVALTRAKEKLILTGTLDKLEKRVETLHALTDRKKRRLPYGMLEGAQDFWGWILPALARHPAFDHLYEQAGEHGYCLNPCYQEEIPFVIQASGGMELVGEEMERQISGELQYRRLLHWDVEQVYEEGLRAQLEERFSYQYPYEHLREIPAKISVSQLKEQELFGEEAEELFREEPVVPLIPEFIKTEKEELKGAARGTAYHRVLELLDYGRVDSQETISEQVEQMKASGKIDWEMARAVRASQILWFVNSHLGKRMQRAWKENRLWREQQFVMSIPAGEKNPDWGEEEQILIQGIIDGFFEEEDGLVLVDYKTDYVEKGREQELVEKYRTQLWYYAEALGRVRRKRVKEAYIYSFAVGKALEVSLKQPGRKKE
ncbi:MAG: helicase-exonuclease AddAB subunit AddA [Clostridiales bacterium]|nr:helicase-exonuclease AddAB subunit AddA [Clostridiales bacterium]